MAKQKYKFERLTPIDNMDLDVYEEAIDYVFSNSDVKNVAISGAYSAGKSSVLASYKKKHGELRFLHISLAHFKSTDQESDAEVKESTLEGKILNQLIHQIPSEKIPQTNFRVKKTVSSKSIATSTIGAVLFLISRKDLFYIYGDTKLWYLKKNLPNNTHVLQRNSLTLIFAVMHWMSELVRYNPQKFEKLMESKQNWLLHEFIEKALYQFVDEISCEITHQEIMTTGYRK